MADEVDRTQERAEHDYLANVCRSRRPTGPVATGRCLFCDELLDDTRRWCDANCRDGWVEENPS